MTAIPTSARTKVKARQEHRCLRCGGRGAEWHHRRSRRVRGPHQHCMCNGVYLCRTCHRWAHAQPHAATLTGYVVSQFIDNPSTIPVHVGERYIHLICTERSERHG